MAEVYFVNGLNPETEPSGHGVPDGEHHAGGRTSRSTHDENLISQCRWRLVLDLTNVCDSFNDLRTENGLEFKTLIELVADQ